MAGNMAVWQYGNMAVYGSMAIYGKPTCSILTPTLFGNFVSLLDGRFSQARSGHHEYVSISIQSKIWSGSELKQYVW